MRSMRLSALRLECIWRERLLRALLFSNMFRARGRQSSGLDCNATSHSKRRFGGLRLGMATARSWRLANPECRAAASRAFAGYGSQGGGCRRGALLHEAFAEFLHRLLDEVVGAGGQNKGAGKVVREDTQLP